jgi:small Trp-rich protein
MAFVLVGVVFLALRLGGWVKFSDSAWVAWLIVLAPFALAWAWWTFSDASGLTQRRAMDALDAKKEARRQKALEALGRGEKQRR